MSPKTRSKQREWSGPAKKTWTRRKILIAGLACVGILATFWTVVAAMVVPLLARTGDPAAAKDNSSVLRPSPTARPVLAQIEVRPIEKAFVATPDRCPPLASPPPLNPATLCDTAKATEYVLAPEALRLGVTAARTAPLPDSTFFAVQVDIDDRSSKLLYDYTAGHPEAELAFVRNGVVITATAFKDPIMSPSFRLTGDFTRPVADDLARGLRGGQ